MRYAFPPRILGVVPAKGASNPARAQEHPRPRRQAASRVGGGCCADIGRFDRLIVSTEDEEVAVSPKSAGWRCHSCGPPELAVDPVEADGVALTPSKPWPIRGSDSMSWRSCCRPVRSAPQTIAAALDLFLSRDEANLMSLSPFHAYAVRGPPCWPERAGDVGVPRSLRSIRQDASRGVSSERCHSRARCGLVSAEPVLQGRPHHRIRDAAGPFGGHRY